MTNRYMAGFDDHDAAGLAYEWSVAGSPTIVAGRTGNCVAVTASNTIIRTVCPEGQQTVTIGFAYLPPARTGSFVIFAVGDGTTQQVLFLILSDGTLAAYKPGTDAFFATTGASYALLGAGTTALAVGAWAYIEIQVMIANAGTVKVRVNGSSTDDIDLSGVDTQRGTATATRIGFACVGSTGYVDDVYVNDSTGTVCNGFMGDMRVDFHLPTADGTHSDWTPSTGTDNYATVDENPQSTADYNSSDTADQIDTFGVEDFKNNGADIQAIQVCLLANKADAGACQIAAMLREDATDTPGTTQNPSTDYGTLIENYSLAVGNAKRAAAGFNACEWGYKKIT